ncbi:probable E3 ubiquitin-protein ligase HIP1 [Phragmites australis]|uniref:probable E3 ubiquitin-protein ligase HIP1 n=1 Tax=Phragmites australis TaxID=29695 RepID=UPI002D78C193|nr:probable E3 ubiquitin-protein ligase HIP1 [Phragmites australis]
MAGHHHNNSQMSRMDHVNRLQNEPPPFGQKSFMHPRSDAPNGALSSGYGSATIRSNDLPSSSYTRQSHTQQIVAPGTLHASYAGSSSSIYAPHNAQHMPALSYPHRSEDNFIPNSHMDDRRVAQKRRNPIIHPMDGASVGSYYAASSSNSQFPHYMPPNPIRAPESCPPGMPSNLGSSHWSDHHFSNHGGSQRNVRGRHDQNSIHLGHSPAVACSSSSIHRPLHHANAIAPPLSTAMRQDRAPFSVPPRVIPPGTDGSSSITFRERPYYPAPQRANIGAPVPTTPGSSDSARFAHGGYAPRVAPHNTIRTYPSPAFANSSNSGVVSHEPAIPSYPPAAPSYLPATSASSSSIHPFHDEAAASLRHLGHLALGPGGNARSRRMRDSYHGFHPLMEENNLGRSAAERFMMLDQLVIHESREEVDPHWDMRLDIDDMSYEELLALEERIGTVNTGLSDEKISGCVVEVACSSSGHTLNNQENASCIICLEEYKPKDPLGRLICGHDFHTDCIKKWLRVKNVCPVCKAAAAADDSGATE